MSLVWLDGAMLPAAEARIDPADRGFLLGDGVFETMRCASGAVCHADRHFARLRDGAATLGIALSWTDDVLLSAIKNLLAAEFFTEAAVRLTVTRGPAARGVWPAGSFAPTVLIAAGPLPPALPPARVIVARSTRRNEASLLARIKSLNYLDGIIARREAALCGADDALLLNTRGLVAEASGSNIFVRRAGRLTTPPIADGALPGIARALILQSGAAEEASVTEAMLDSVESAFLTNSLGRRPIASINGRQLNA